MEEQVKRNKVVIEPSENIRRRGRQALKGKWGIAIGVTSIYMLFISLIPTIIKSFFNIGFVLNSGPTELALSYSPISWGYTLLITGPITFGLINFFMALVRKDEKEEFSIILSGFENFSKTLGLFLWITLWTILWAIIPIAGPVLGIIASIKYSQSFLILRDNPNMLIAECVNESKRLMDGNKAKYFSLCLSFIGWILLSFVAVFFVLVIVGIVMAAFQVTWNYDFISNIVAFIPSIIIMIYLRASLVSFYDILTQRIEGETYTPGEY